MSRSIHDIDSPIRPFALATLLCFTVHTAQAQSGDLPGTQMVASKLGFDALLKAVEAAVETHKMGLVASASASRGAAGRGVQIPGNAVLMVFRNDYAVRVLEASVPAGIEAPIRIYVTENADGTATLRYRRPSAVFAPYASARLDRMAKGELHPVFERIVRDATSGK